MRLGVATSGALSEHGVHGAQTCSRRAERGHAEPSLGAWTRSLPALRAGVLSLGVLALGACERNEDAPPATDVAPLQGPEDVQRPEEKASPPEAPQPPTAPPAANADVVHSTTSQPASETEVTPAGVAEGRRVYAKARFVWVRSAPTTETQWIGYLWTGGSVALRDEASVEGRGCKKRWYPIEPRGWVCVDDERATLDPNDPVVQAVAPYRGRLETPWPHQYAAVPRPLRRYALLPGPGPQPFPAFPSGLQEGRPRMRDRSTLAYIDEVERDGKAFLLAADLSWVAKKDVEPYDRIEFQGLRLEGDVQLPLAFFRGEDRPGYRLTPSGEFERSDVLFPRLSWVKLTGKKQKSGKETYFETTRDGLWVRRGGAVVPSPRGTTPWGAPVGQPDTTGEAPRGRGTWIEVSVLEGWLVAFEGTRPVYVTLISAGRGGTPHGDRDPVETASTPIGSFAINGKYATATMESPVKIVHSDVPWTQNFSGPHALHGAYWHDNWGSLMSAGCINLSPRDARWLYDFTDPPVPEGWHGVRHVPRYGPQTRLIVHE